MFDLKIEFDGRRLESALIAAVGEEARRRAAATAITRVVAAARVEVQRQLPDIFDRPTPFTEHAIRYEAATAETVRGSVYISDDSNRGLSPRRYLGPEILGGPRGMKGSERRLQDMGIMERAQAVVPGRGMPLDAYGNVSGARMVTILSRVKAFGDESQGFMANASKFTKDRLAKARRAAATSRTDYFVAHSKRGGEPLGIWQLVGPGHVEPVLVFANRLPNYKSRFHFERIVEDFAAKHFGDEMVKALLEGIGKNHP